jgi:hypothetical protein
MLTVTVKVMLRQTDRQTDSQSVSQSVSMSWCQVHSGTCDQTLYSVWKLLCFLCVCVCVGFINPLGGVISVQRQINSICWAQLSRSHLKKATESSLRNIVFKIKDRAMDNVHNCDRYINVPSPQTCRSAVTTSTPCHHHNLPNVCSLRTFLTEI